MSKRKITIDDLLALRWVSDPQVSSDGARVVFVQTEVARDSDSYRSHLWITPLGGGPPRQFSWGDHRDSSPQWSTDGRWIAFLSDRGAPTPEAGAKKAKQIYVISADGGEARPLSAGSMHPSDLTWSPDGQLIAFVGRPEVKNELAGDVKVITRIRYKFDGEGFWDGRYKHIFVVPVAGGGVRQLTSGDFDHVDPAWSPDGRWLACVANRTSEGDFTNVTDVWIVPVTGGEPRCLTRSIGPCAAPAWAPDGRSIAYFGHDNAYLHATNTNLWIVSADGGAPTNLTAAYDRSLVHHVLSDMRVHPNIGGPVWSSDGKTLFFLAADGGTTQLGAVESRAGATVRLLTTARHEIFAYSFDRRCETVVIAASDPHTPGDLWAFSVDPGGTQVRNRRRLTALNEALLNELVLSSPERFEYEGADGWRVEGWVLRPVEYREGNKYPTILEIHGGPHAAYGQAFFHEFQLLAAQGFAIVYTNPRGSQGYGQQFTAATRHDWGGKDYEDIMRGLDVAIARFPFIDPEQLGVAGGSYGGYMTNWVIGHTTRFKAAVTMRSISNHLSQWGTSDLAFMKGFWEFPGDPWEASTWYWERSPLAYVSRIVTPLLIVHSEQDLRCPIGEAEQLFAALRKLRRDVVLLRFPHESHNLSRTGQPSHRVERLRWIVRWFAEHLGPRRPAAAKEPVVAGGEADP